VCDKINLVLSSKPIKITTMKSNLLRTSAIAAAVLAMLSLDSCKKEKINPQDPLITTTSGNTQSRVPAGLYTLETTHGYLQFNSQSLYDEMINDTLDTLEADLKVELNGLSGYTSYSEATFTETYMDGLTEGSDVWWNARSLKEELATWIVNEDGVLGYLDYLVRLDFESRDVYIRFNDGDPYDQIMNPDPEDDLLWKFSMDDDIIHLIHWISDNENVYDSNAYNGNWSRGCNEAKAASDFEVEGPTSSGVQYLATQLPIQMRMHAKYEKFGIYCVLFSESRMYVNSTDVYCNVVHNGDLSYDPRCSSAVGPFTNNNWSGTTSAQNGEFKKKHYRSTNRLRTYSLNIRVRHASGTAFTPYATISG